MVKKPTDEVSENVEEVVETTKEEVVLEKAEKKSLSPKSDRCFCPLPSPSPW